jgi:hypothetical protein
MGKPGLVLVCEEGADARIWGRFPERLAEWFEVDSWELRDGQPAPDGGWAVAVGQADAVDAVVGLVAAGRAAAGVLISPMLGLLALELGTVDQEYRAARLEFFDVFEEFTPQLVSGDFPEAERRRLVVGSTAELEPLLARDELELVRQVQVDALPWAMRRGLELRAGNPPADEELTEEERASRTAQLVSDHLAREEWFDRAAGFGDRLTVLTGPGQRTAGPLLEPRLRGVRVVNPPTRTDYPWLEDPDELVGVVREAAGGRAEDR